MKSSRVLYLLLSVLQFILFLKLIEVVRGEEADAQLHSQVSTEERSALNSTSQDGNGRGLFIAPKMKKKKVLRPWNGKSSDFSAMSNKTVSNVIPSERITDNGLVSQKNQTVNVKKDPGDVQSGRLCPACANNQCPITEPITAGFPIVPFIIAVIVGVKWFIIFLIIWIFFVRPDKHSQQSGYGYGGASQSESDSQHSFLDNIFDKIPFLNEKRHGHQRSLESLTSVLNLVLDSVSKFSNLYNDE